MKCLLWSFLAAVYIFCNVLPHNWLRRLKPFRSQDRSSIYIFYSKETFYLLPEGVIFIFHFESPLCARIKTGHFLWKGATSFGVTSSASLNIVFFCSKVFSISSLAAPLLRKIWNLWFDFPASFHSFHSKSDYTAH